MNQWQASRRTFLAGSAALAATSNAAFAQTSAQAPAHLIVGASAIDGATGLVSAQHNGYFRKNAIDVEVAIGSGAASAAAVSGGSIQLAASNIVTLIKAHLNGLPFQIVAPSSMYVTDNPTQVLVVRNDAGIKTGADLNGKTIAVTAIGDVLSTATLAWVDKNGGTSSTVKLVEVPTTSIAQALQTGRVQAASLAEPFLSQAVETGSVRVFAKIFDAIAPRFLQAAYFGMPAWINANADVSKRFANALLEGNAFANAHPDQTLPWMIEYSKIDPAIMKKARREHFGEAVDPALIQVEIDALARMKMIDRAFDAKDMISPVTLNMKAPK